MANSSSNGSSSTKRRSSSTSGRGRSSSSRGSSSRSRSSNSGLSSIPSSINRSILLPVSRTVSRSSWLPYALGAVGIGVILYGLSRISIVREVVSSGYDGVSDMFGGNDMASDIEDSFGFEEDVRVLKNDLSTLNRAL